VSETVAIKSARDFARTDRKRDARIIRSQPSCARLIAKISARTRSGAAVAQRNGHSRAGRSLRSRNTSKKKKKEKKNKENKKNKKKRRRRKKRKEEKVGQERERGKDADRT